MNIRKQALHYRNQLLTLEQNTERQMTQSYQLVWKDIKQQLDSVQSKIAQAGDQIEVSWLYREVRLESLLQQIQKRLAGYTEQQIATTAHNQQIGVQLGIESAGEMLGKYPSFTALPQGAIDHLILKMQQPLDADYGPISDIATRKIKKTLLTAVATGQNPLVTARLLQQSAGIALWQSVRIARTETLNAYRAANSAVFQANSDIVTGWIWSAAAGCCAV